MTAQDNLAGSSEKTVHYQWCEGGVETSLSCLEEIMSGNFRKDVTLSLLKNLASQQLQHMPLLEEQACIQPLILPVAHCKN